MIRVLLLEDNRTLNKRIVDILNGWDFVETVYSALSVSEFDRMVDRDNIDIFLSDLGLPDGCGADCIQTFCDKHPNGRAIIISSNTDGGRILEGIQKGAIGYIFKNDTSFEIIAAIKIALRGESPISPAIAHFMIKHLMALSEAEAEAEAEAAHTVETQATPLVENPLTPREHEVLVAISKGLTYVETASVLGMSKNTVPVHIRNIFVKLQASNRSEAVYEAQVMGIL